MRRLRRDKYQGCFTAKLPYLSAMDRPTIFISSTIYDFRDMRSAIKDHLEENGCRILASEFNDFTKPLDRHSYQACLDTIEQADIFLLLIGTRVGGWYDKTNRISITQQEYRTAYQLAQEGRIRLLSFVRADVWTHRQDTKDLQRHLKGLAELDDAIRQRIVRYPTAIASDSDFIVSFIDEISRNKETAEASKGKGTMPIGNWVHTFTGFSDIRDVLDPLILNGLSVKNAAGKKALQNQLLTLLRDVLPLVKGKPIIPAPTIQNLAREIKLNANDLGKSTTLSEKTWSRFIFLAMIMPRTGLDSAALSSVLGTDLLLEYDPKKGRFRQTQAYDILTDLIDQIRKFEQAKSGVDVAKLIEFGLPTARGRDKSVSVPIHLVAGQLQVFFRWADIAAIAKVLALALDGKPLTVPLRMPLTPFLDQEEEIAKEQVSLEQVRQFVELEAEKPDSSTPKSGGDKAK